MTHMVLGVGYQPAAHEVVRREWREHNVDFHFVDSVDEVIQRLQQVDYVCITICTCHIDNEQLERLRSMGPIPIVVLSPQCSVRQRAEYFQQGAVGFILNAHQSQKAEESGKDAVQYYLDLPQKGTDPLTIITDKDFCFCLEHRTVMVCEQEIELTPMEFDALYLLITNRKRVLTFEIISVRVWGEEYIDISPKVINNLIGRLRQKLKVTPDAPEYIKNIRGVGYKFDTH